MQTLERNSWWKGEESWWIISLFLVDNLRCILFSFQSAPWRIESILPMVFSLTTPCLPVVWDGSARSKLSTHIYCAHLSFLGNQVLLMPTFQNVSLPLFLLSQWLFTHLSCPVALLSVSWSHLGFPWTRVCMSEKLEFWCRLATLKELTICKNMNKCLRP